MPSFNTYILDGIYMDYMSDQICLLSTQMKNGIKMAILNTVDWFCDQMGFFGTFFSSRVELSNLTPSSLKWNNLLIFTFNGAN